MAASVILAKCSVHSGTFGIRVEKRENDWVSTWAFPIDESKAKREGFDKTKITGSLTPIDGYPGCPYCGDNELVQCACGKMICHREGRVYSNTEKTAEKKSEKKLERKAKNNAFRCQWCSMMIDEINVVESFTVKSDRF